ncbi:MAG: alkaline phosphatase family protein [Pseudolabrys sp.]
MGAHMAGIDEIKHVVVLILENHSFDQMLGCLKAVYPGLDGVDPANPRQNVDDEGTVFAQAPTTERQMLLDPHHEVEHVAVQLSNHNGGFVRDFVESFPTAPATARQYVMGYYPLDFLPALHKLGRNFTVCDRWFSSLPGPTWPNRFFALSGTCLGRVDMPGDGTSGKDLPGFFHQTQVTIFDRLTDAGVHWKVYFHDVPQSWTMKRLRAPHNAARYFYIDQFFADARGAALDFPDFSLIEPDYMGSDENDDHPPHDIMKAEKLIADVYNALRGNEELWRSTLLVTFYDEHGGFYDHVEPTAAVPPDDHTATSVDPHNPWTFGFDRFGVRVPAILASPWVDAGVEKAQFDHTSVLKFVQEKWHLPPLPSRRIAAATSIGVALRNTPRMDALPRIVLDPNQLVPPDPELEEAAFGIVSEHHQGLARLTEYLIKALWEDAKVGAVEAAPRLYSSGSRLAVWLLDWLRGRCEWGMARFYGTAHYKVALAKPDHLASESATPRNRVVRFLTTQKSRAVEGLAARIGDEGRRLEERHHSLRTLAAITGRPFDRHEDTSFAKAWMARHGEKVHPDVDTEART